MSECFVKFNENLPKGRSTEGKAFERRVEQEVKARLKEDPSKSEGDHRADVIDELIASEEKALEVQRIQVAHEFATRRRLTTSLRSFANVKGTSARKAFFRVIESMAGEANARGRMTIDQLHRDLQENGLDKYMTSFRKNPEEELNVVKELYEATRSDGTPGVSGSKDAQKFVEIYRSHMDALNADGERFGVAAPFLEGWITRQMWSPDRLEKFTANSEDPAGTFADAMLPHIDRAKTLGDVAAPDARVIRFLREFYTDSTNRNIEKEVPFNLRDLRTQRTETFAQKQLKSREIHTKTPESFKFVFDNFSPDTLGGALLRSMEHRAQRTAAAQNLGPNPVNMSEFLINETKRLAREKGQPAPFKARGTLDTTSDQILIDGMLLAAGGKDDIDATSPALAKLFMGVRNYARALNLGRVVSYFPTEIATADQARARVVNGVSKSNIEMARQVVSRIEKATKDFSPETIDVVRVAVNTAHAYSMGRETGRMDAGSGTLGAFVNLSDDVLNLTLKWQGMNYVTELKKTEAGIAMNSIISALRSKPFKEIDDSVRETLLRGGILEEDWEKLRKLDEAFADIENEGLAYLDLGRLNKLDVDLARKVRFTIREFADEAVITPGVFERAILTGGTAPGTVSGELIRLVTDLLGWPTTFITKGLLRELRVDGKRGLTILSTKMFAAGIVATMLNDAVQGRTRDYLSDDPEDQMRLFGEYAARGGLGGIFGDSLAKAIDPRFGQGPLESLLAAPAISTMDDAVTGFGRVVKETATGDFSNALYQAAKTVERAVPFTDLPQTSFLTQLILDEIGHTLGGSAEEAVNARKANLRSSGIEQIDPAEAFSR